MILQHLQNLDQAGFYRQLMRSRCSPQAIFVWPSTNCISINAADRWRRWLTNAYLGAWLGNRTYYRMQLTDSATTILISASPTT